MLRDAMPNRAIGRQFATGIVCCACALTGLARTRGQETTFQARGQTTETQENDQNEPGSSTDEELFKKLIGGDTSQTKPREDPLEQAIRGMREAQQRIDGSHTGLKTRTLQQDVVKNLQRLIENIQQQAQSSSSSGRLPRLQNDESIQPASKPPEPSRTGSADNGATRKDKSAESSDQPRGAENRQVVPLSSGRMIRDVWGQLPPTLRQKLLNVYEDKYLPKYDDLVRRYFESLAEEGRSAPPNK